MLPGRRPTLQFISATSPWTRRDGSQLEAARAMCESWPTSFRFLPAARHRNNLGAPEHPAQQPLERRLLERLRVGFGSADAKDSTLIAQTEGVGAKNEPRYISASQVLRDGDPGLAEATVYR